jgi:uncharacterized DUF497 family protein
MPEFEWDEAKRFTNIRKHGLDFKHGRRLFDGRPVLITVVDYPGEVRLSAIGELDDEMVTAFWTIRGDKIRLISMRRASRAERRQYRQLYG